MYLALYRRFRPETFERVLGQEHIVKILTNQLHGGTVGHAYLFCGTRGTGKTTMARLLAKGVNCLSDGERPCGVCANCVAIKEGIFVDVIEIDAASNNGVENIRELRESVKYPPSVGRRKVYIIDEVHMLSAGAFNALLKTLEEPPGDVMFVLATTERQKLPATILSRCLRLDFKRVSAEAIKKGMRDICAELGVGITEDALALIASNADGSVRDGLSLLDQCVSAGADGVTRDTVLELLGSPGEEQLALLTDMISDGDISGALLHLNRLLDEGRDERQLIKDWIEHFRNLMLIRHLERPEDMLNMSVENIEKLREQCLRLTPAFVNDSIFTLAGTLNDARWTTRPRVLLEIGLIKMAAAQLPGDVAAVSPAPAAKPASARPERAVAKPAPAVASPTATVAEPTMTVAIPERTAAKSEPATEPVLTPESVPTESPVPEEHSPAPMPPATLDWRAVIAEVKKKNSVLSRLDNRSSLAEIGRGAFVIEVFDKFTKDVAEDGREQIEAAVARMTGTPLHMDCRLNESADGGQKSARARRKNPPAPAADIAPEPTPDGEETQLQETFDFGAGRD